jgi:hypothetical protein
MAEKQSPPYSLRMSDEMREKLEQSALRNSRSLNAEIVHRLENSLSFEDARQSGVPMKVAVDLASTVELLVERMTEIDPAFAKARALMDQQGRPVLKRDAASQAQFDARSEQERSVKFNDVASIQDRAQYELLLGRERELMRHVDLKGPRPEWLEKAADPEEALNQLRELLTDYDMRGYSPETANTEPKAPAKKKRFISKR